MIRSKVLFFYLIQIYMNFSIFYNNWWKKSKRKKDNHWRLY